jgi:hypothetical protein
MKGSKVKVLIKEKVDPKRFKVQSSPQEKIRALRILQRIRQRGTHEENARKHLVNN